MQVSPLRGSRSMGLRLTGSLPMVYCSAILRLNDPFRDFWAVRLAAWWTRSVGSAGWASGNGSLPVCLAIETPELFPQQWR